MEFKNKLSKEIELELKKIVLKEIELEFYKKELQ